MAAPALLPYGIPSPAGSLPAGLTLGPVRLAVRSLDLSLQFYSEVLGLGLLARDGQRATLGIGSTRTPLLLLDEQPGLRATAPRSRLGLFHFAILLPDRAALGRFITHLGRIGARAGASDHLVSEALYLTDPDGLGIEIYADRPRASWQHESRQLVMDTAPLDLHDLVRAAGNTPWSGMPEGTTMGHLHLHVGDLARADEFYHLALGFDQVVWNYPGALFLSAGGYHHHLGLNTWAEGSPSAGERDARLLSWEINLPTANDLAETEARLKHLDVLPESDAVEAGGDESVKQRVLLLRDPWGTALRLTAPM